MNHEPFSQYYDCSTQTTSCNRGGNFFQFRPQAAEAQQECVTINFESNSARATILGFELLGFRALTTWQTTKGSSRSETRKLRCKSIRMSSRFEFGRSVFA